LLSIEIQLDVLRRRSERRRPRGVFAGQLAADVKNESAELRSFVTD
jgi:hypothetical protein